MMLTQFVFNMFIFIINKNTTPCHILIMLIIGQFAPYIKKVKNDTKKSMVLIFGLLVILFFALVFNEILEVNCFGLQKNTKKNISIRARIDSLSVGIIDFNKNDDDSDDSDNNNEEDEKNNNDNDNGEREPDENDKINDSRKINSILDGE